MIRQGVSSGIVDLESEVELKHVQELKGGGEKGSPVGYHSVIGAITETDTTHS